MNKCFFFLICLLVFQHSFSQTNNLKYSADAVLQRMQKLRTIGSVLYIAAHPDDENTRLLTYLANEKKLRTAYLSLTRGDGGQNLIGKEQGAALGLIRTQELLAAREIDGARQYFTRAVDFGFSKTPEETFEHWNKDSVLSDVVWVIRKFKPDIIITRFPATGEGGHGHHTASAILAEEAFEAAADANKFTWQLQYTQPWKAKKLFWNTFNFGEGRNTTAPDQLAVNVGIFNPLMGKYYGEIAAESRTMHKSQGFGAAASRGKSLEYFKQLKGDAVKNDLFENIVLDWNRFSPTGELNKMIDVAISSFRVLAPEKSLDALLDLHKKLKSIQTQDQELLHWRALKLCDLQELIITTAGIWTEAIAQDSVVTPEEDFEVAAKILVHTNVPVQLMQNDMAYRLQRNEDHRFKTVMLLSRFKEAGLLAEVSEPYWLKHPIENNLFRADDIALLGMPQKDPELNMIFHVKIKDVAFDIAQPVMYRYVDPVRGEVYRPLDVLPPITFYFNKEMLLFANDQPQKTKLTIKANKNNVTGKLQANVPEKWHAMLSDSLFTLERKGDEKTVEMLVFPASQGKEGVLNIAAVAAGKNYRAKIKRINYNHIPPQFILEKAAVKLVNLNLEKSGTTIGYIPGAGDETAELLSQIGYNVTILHNEDLAEKGLAQFDAIVTGIRAYNINEQLDQHYHKLMEYVKNGGNLVVQYNTNTGIGPLRAEIGPYPFTISRNRVTDENAEVTFTLPQHSVLNYPNKILQKDFEGWVQERGIYFADKTDEKYRTVLSMHDKGEPAQSGSIIIARYGRGNFVYTGISFFRQLPAGNPGAYKLFVNLLSIPKR